MIVSPFIYVHLRWIASNQLKSDKPDTVERTVKNSSFIKKIENDKEDEIDATASSSKTFYSFNWSLDKLNTLAKENHYMYLSQKLKW